jgi:hypothetical protein
MQKVRNEKVQSILAGRFLQVTQGMKSFILWNRLAPFE